MNLIIIGPQGSGKGTQGKLVSEKLNLFSFETGKYLRVLARSDSGVNEIINKKGELIPDEDMFALVTAHLEKNDSDLGNFILDGYPRSIRQYQLLKNWLKNKGSKIDKAILLDISERESLKRLSARRICEDCGRLYNLITNPPPKEGCECGGKLIQREDDKPKAIKKRLALYYKITRPLIKIFEKENILLKINGEQAIEKIFNEIIEKLEK